MDSSGLPMLPKMYTVVPTIPELTAKDQSSQFDLAELDLAGEMYQADHLHADVSASGFPDKSGELIIRCVHDREEAQQLISGRMEIDECELESLLEGIDMTELLSFLPVEDGVASSQPISRSSLRYLLSLPVLVSKNNVRSQQYLAECASLQYSDVDRVTILCNHPLFETLKYFIKMKIALIHKQESPRSKNHTYKSIHLAKQTVVLAKKEFDNLELSSNPLCPHAFTSGYPEADEVILGAVKSAVQLCNDDKFIDVIVRADEDCNSMLTSVSSFCQNLLQTARKDAEEHKKNTATNRTSSIRVSLKDKTNTKQKYSKKTSCVQTKKRKYKIIPRQSLDILRQWLIEHADNPYPNNTEKIELCLRTDMTLDRLNQWFINGRRRVLASMGLLVPRI